MVSAMLSLCFRVICISLILSASACATSTPESQAVLAVPESDDFDRNVSRKLFYELEELARMVDISYCVGTTGIHKPFLCASRCQEFPGFELVTASARSKMYNDLCYGANDLCRHGTQARFLPTRVATLPLPILHHGRASWLRSEERTLWLILSSTYPRFRRNMFLIRETKTPIC